MTRSSDLYETLTHALEDTEPACRDDGRFILERAELAPDEIEHLARTVCATCPVRKPCSDYAEVKNPLAGIWGGHMYPKRRKRTEKS